MSDDPINDAKLREYGSLFSQLMLSQRFTELVNMYFTFHQVLDEDTKEITYQVIENPPEIIAQRLQEQAAQQKQDQPQIELVSGSKAQKILAAAEAKGRKAKGR